MIVGHHTDTRRRQSDTIAPTQIACQALGLRPLRDQSPVGLQVAADGDAVMSPPGCDVCAPDSRNSARPATSYVPRGFSARWREAWPVSGKWRRGLWRSTTRSRNASAPTSVGTWPSCCTRATLRGKGAGAGAGVQQTPDACGAEAGGMADAARRRTGDRAAAQIPARPLPFR